MFLHGNVVDEWYTLNNGSKRAGEINLRIQFIGAGAQGAKAGKASTGQVAYAQAQAYPVPQAAYPAPQGECSFYDVVLNVFMSSA